MADFADRASKVTADQEAMALANIQKYEGESEEDCLKCGVKIPEARRKHVPGCTLCVDCKSVEELRSKRFIN